jgi:hypothetical protein
MRQKTENREKEEYPNKQPSPLSDVTATVSLKWFEQWTLIVLASVLALTVLGVAGCARVESGDLQRIEVTNGRFERSSRPTLQGGDFWIRRGDTIHARWDEYTMYFTKVGATCDNLHFDGDNCSRCQVVHQNSSECGGRSFVPGDYLDLDDFYEFRSDSSWFSTPISLPQIQTGDLGIVPGQSKFYRLSTTEEGKIDPWASARVFMVERPPTQGTPKLYKAEPLPQPGVTDAVFYQVKVPDNFSENLKISKIAVKKGIPVKNVQFGLKDGGTLLKPSRIVLMEGFTDGSRVYDNDRTRCYASYPNGTPDMAGNIDLGSCFHDLCPPNTSCTPTIITANPEFQIIDHPELTWAIEFKPTDGGEVPVLADGEVVAIEFTILAK